MPLHLNQIKTRLLAFGAISVGATTFVAAIAKCVPDAGMAPSTAASICANNLATLAVRLGRNQEILHHHDLTKAIGFAIALVIQSVAEGKDYRIHKIALQKLAKTAVNDWQDIATTAKEKDCRLEVILEPPLAIFSNDALFEVVTALDLYAWIFVLDWLTRKAEVKLPSDVIQYVASQLHTTLPKALREVLKEDFKSGGKVFAGLTLWMLGEIWEALRSTLDTANQVNELQTKRTEVLVATSGSSKLIQQVFERLYTFTQLKSATDKQLVVAFFELAPMIESGFSKVLKQMGVAINTSTLLAEVRGERGRGGEGISIALLAQASFNRLSPKLQALFLNLSIYRRPFNHAAAAAQLPQVEVSQQDLEQLVQYSLLQEQIDQNGERVYQFHPYILAYAKHKAGARTLAREQAIAYYLSIAKEPLWQTLDDITEFLEVFYHGYELKLYALAFDTLKICDDFLALQGCSGLRVQQYEQLLEVWQPSLEESSQYMDCLMRLSHAHCALGQYSQAIKRYRELLQTAREVNAPEWETFALSTLGGVYLSIGQVQQAVELFEQCLEICKEIGDRRGEAKSLNSLGNACNALGQFQPAIVCSQRSLKIAREIGELDGEATALLNLGCAYNSLGQYQRAIESYQQSLEINQKIGSRTGEADALTGLGNAYYSLKQYQQATDFYQQALSIAQELGTRREANALSGLGRVYRVLRQYPQAIECYHQSLEIARKVCDRQGEAVTLGNLGTAYYSLKQYQQAIDYCQQQLDIATEIGDRQGEANSLGNLGNAYQSLGQYQRAIEFHERSLAIKREIGDKRGEANSWFNLGKALAKLARTALAINAYQKSRELYQGIGLMADVLDAENAIEHLSPKEEACQPVQPNSNKTAEVRVRSRKQKFYPSASI